MVKSKKWVIGWFVIVVLGLGALGAWVYKVDPYIHYHKPDTSKYYYSLDNHRSQNDGIIKHFDYDALIIGTSMTENFKTSEMNEIFGCNSIKVPFTGGSFKEINDNINNAIESNPNIKYIVRGIDMEKFFDGKDKMRYDLGVYPTYLYDDNVLNDVKYIWNRDVIWNRTFPMTKNKESGITSFDDYSNWNDLYSFGVNTVCPDGLGDIPKGEYVHLNDEEKKKIAENISLNVTSIAQDNPDITFYYFFTPYSAAWWTNFIPPGTIKKEIEAERFIIETILKCDNIKLFSFNNRLDITCNLNNYKDTMHYGEWINTMILHWMHDGNYQLTKENYEQYLQTELDNYSNLDYAEIGQQSDYEADYFAAAILNQELRGAQPKKLLETNKSDFELKNAKFVNDQLNGSKGISCTGSLDRKPDDEKSVLEYVKNTNYVGASIEIDNVDDYGYLTFFGKKLSDHGQPTVYVIDESGAVVAQMSPNYYDIDNEWHQYVLDITKAKGKVRIIFNGGYIDDTGSKKSKYNFCNIILY